MALQHSVTTQVGVTTQCCNTCSVAHASQCCNTMRRRFDLKKLLRLPIKFSLSPRNLQTSFHGISQTNFHGSRRDSPVLGRVHWKTVQSGDLNISSLISSVKGSVVPQCCNTWPTEHTPNQHLVKESRHATPCITLQDTKTLQHCNTKVHCNTLKESRHVRIRHNTHK